VPVKIMSRNGSTSGLERLLKTSAYPASVNLKHMRVDVVKNWFDLVADGYLRISSTSSNCASMAREMGGADVDAEELVERRYNAIESQREQHMVDSSIRLADLSPGSLTPDELEQYKSVLGLDFEVPEENYDEIERELKKDVSNEGKIEEPVVEEPVVEEPVAEEPVVEEPVEEDAPQLTTAPQPTIHLTPQVTGTPEPGTEPEVEEVEDVEEAEEPASREMPGSMVERIEERRKRKSSTSSAMLKTAQNLNAPDTESKVAGWSNLRYVKLLADRQPNMSEIGLFNYIDHSKGLEGTLGTPAK